MSKNYAKPIELGILTSNGPVAIFRDRNGVMTTHAIQVTHSTVRNEELVTMDLSLAEAETFHEKLGIMIAVAKAEKEE